MGVWARQAVRVLSVVFVVGMKDARSPRTNSLPGGVRCVVAAKEIRKVSMVGVGGWAGCRQGAAAASLARQLKLSLLWAQAQFLLAGVGNATGPWSEGTKHEYFPRCGNMFIRLSQPSGGRQLERRAQDLVEIMTATCDSFRKAHASSVSYHLRRQLPAPIGSRGARLYHFSPRTEPHIRFQLSEPLRRDRPYRLSDRWHNPPALTPPP